MLERILIPLEASEKAEAVVPRLRRILLRRHADILLLRVLSPEEGREGAGAALRLLEAVEKAVSAEGVMVRSLVRTGEAAASILDVAEKEKATLIALPATETGPVGKLLRASAQPVLAVRPGDGGREDFAPRTILVPVDAAGASLKILEPAVELASVFRSQVKLIHVFEDPHACSVPVPQLTEAYARVRDAGLDAEPLLRKGDPADEILLAAREGGAELIAMATHGRSGPSRWLHGSVAERVLKSSDLPLLVVRAEG